MCVAATGPTSTVSRKSKRNLRINESFDLDDVLPGVLHSARNAGPRIT